MKKTILMLALLMAFFSFSGLLDTLTFSLGQRLIRAPAEEYLDNSLDQALVGFGTMSVLKAGLDIVEGSTVGVNAGLSANIEAGDIAQPAYDFVDIAWRTILWACVMLLSLQYLLQAAGMLDHYMLGLTLMILSLYLVAKWWLPKWLRMRTVFKDILTLGVVLTLVLYYALPLSIWGASKLSHAITKPSVEEAQTGFNKIKNDILPESFLAKDDDKDKNWWDSVKDKVSTITDIPSKIANIPSYLGEKLRDITVWSLKLIVGYLFDCIVFPLLMFVFLLRGVRAGVQYIFRVNWDISAQETLAALLIKKNGADKKS